MIREVDLASYLPEFMQGYTEPVEVLKAENPEFQIFWKATDKTLKNRYISTADEYGISRFERLLGILPPYNDSLESRKARVQSRWFMALPYTYRILTSMVAKIVGSDYDFYIWSDFTTSYELILTVCALDDSQDAELKYILDHTTPLTIPVSIIYESPLKGDIYFGGVMCEADILEMKERGTVG